MLITEDSKTQSLKSWINYKPPVYRLKHWYVSSTTAHSEYLTHYMYLMISTNICSNVCVCCLSAGGRYVPGSMETSSHRAGIMSWLPWRFARWHQGRPDRDASAPLGGKARWARWYQEETPSVWESQEGHVGELHFAQVLKLYCLHLTIFGMFFFYLTHTLEQWYRCFKFLLYLFARFLI